MWMKSRGGFQQHIWRVKMATRMSLKIRLFHQEVRHAYNNPSNSSLQMLQSWLLLWISYSSNLIHTVWSDFLLIKISVFVNLIERLITTTNYKAELDDEISFEIGVLVTVLEKNFDGWWLIRWVLWPILVTPPSSSKAITWIYCCVRFFPSQGCLLHLFLVTVCFKHRVLFGLLQSPFTCT